MTRFKWCIVGMVAVMLLASLAMSLHAIVSEAIPTIASGVSLPVIVIDPGHGGADGGAVGVDDVIEKDINLAIAFQLRDLFVINGFEVVMTRETDISIHDAGVEGLRAQKTSDLHNRMAIMESYPDAIFISIHQNKFGDSSQNGTQIFFGPGDPRSEELATLMQQRMIEQLQPENRRVQKRGEKNLYLIYEASCPAILIECGFLSNAAEAARLSDPEYQAQLAFVMMSSVVEYIGLQSPDPGAAMS